MDLDALVARSYLVTGDGYSGDSVAGRGPVEQARSVYPARGLTHPLQ